MAIGTVFRDKSPMPASVQKTEADLRDERLSAEVRGALVRIRRPYNRDCPHLERPAFDVTIESIFGFRGDCRMTRMTFINPRGHRGTIDLPFEVNALAGFLLQAKQQQGILDLSVDNLPEIAKAYDKNPAFPRAVLG